MEAIETKLKNAAAAKDIPGVVLIAANSSNRTYTFVTGVKSLKEDATLEPLPINATMWLASATKLMTSISALQCVERGLFTLDEDITRLLPEFKGIDILKGFKEDSEKPILVKATKKITLKHLLTHTSGLAYDAFNPLLQKWRKFRGEEAHFTNGSLKHRCLVPLLFEPGELFEYSVGIDWAGQMVERATGMSLEDYMRINIWVPLEINNISFRPQLNSFMKERLSDISERQGGLNSFGTPADPTQPVAYAHNRPWPLEMEDNNGGAGAFGSMFDYYKIVHSILTDNGLLLTSSMVDKLFEPQLSETSQAHLDMLLGIKEVRDIMGVSEGSKIGHGLGGVVTLEDIEGRRKKGTMSWQGLPNVYWWADRVGGIGGVFATQIMPVGDPKSLELFREFEKSIYAHKF